MAKVIPHFGLPAWRLSWKLLLKRQINPQRESTQTTLSDIKFYSDKCKKGHRKIQNCKTYFVFHRKKQSDSWQHPTSNTKMETHKFHFNETLTKNALGFSSDNSAPNTHSFNLKCTIMTFLGLEICLFFCEDRTEAHWIWLNINIKWHYSFC